jgi:hypothetical protein
MHGDVPAARGETERQPAADAFCRAGDQHHAGFRRGRIWRSGRRNAHLQCRNESKSSRIRQFTCSRPDALAQSEALTARIRAEIASAGGWLPFSRYMELALYAPGLGYYSGGAMKFGKRGDDGSDFVTAPEMSPLFSATLARPVAQALRDSGTRNLMEFGAGTGKLAAGC